MSAGFALVLLALAGCAEYPRDPERTSARVESGVMRVGVVHDPPFVRLRGAGAPRGAEVEFARALARSMDARVAWVSGGHDALLVDLEAFRLDLVLGGLAADTPWKQRVALIRPYKARDQHGRLVPRVLAVPPGENRWQLRVERFSRSEAGRAVLEGPLAEDLVVERPIPEGHVLEGHVLEGPVLEVAAPNPAPQPDEPAR